MPCVSSAHASLGRPNGTVWVVGAVCRHTPQRPRGPREFGIGFGAKVKPGPGSFSCSRKYNTPLHSNFIQRANSRLQDASTSNSHPRRCSVLRYIFFECRCRHGIGTPTCYLQTHRDQQQFFYRLFLLRALHSAFRTTQPNPWSIDEPQILAAANACIYRCFISSHEDRHVRLWS